MFCVSSSWSIGWQAGLLYVVVEFPGHTSHLARTLKTLRTSKGDYWSKQ